MMFQEPYGTLKLPCFEEYDRFAMIAVSEAVSNICDVYLCLTWIVFQNNYSYYALLDSQKIIAPVPTGFYVEVPYYHGFKYVAFKAQGSSQVKINLKPNIILICASIFKAFLNATMPNLLHLSFECHLLDLKVASAKLCS